MTLQQIVDQLKACQYTCEAGKLELNTYFLELEERAKQEAFIQALMDKQACKFELKVIERQCESIESQLML